MTEKRVKLPSFTTPKGVFKFPKLNEPDTKFKDEGEYSVKLVLEAQDAQSLIAKLQPLMDAAEADGKAKHAALDVAARKKNPFKVVAFCSPLYDDEENETGQYEFKFGMKASGVAKKTGKPWTRKPAIYAAVGTKPLTTVPAIWGGTVGRVSFEVLAFFVAAVGAGLSLRLNAVQIIELAGPNSRSAADYGFGEEEGGFGGVSDDAPAADEGETAPASGGDSTDF